MRTTLGELLGRRRRVLLQAVAISGALLTVGAVTPDCDYSGLNESA